MDETHNDLYNYISSLEISLAAYYDYPLVVFVNLKEAKLACLRNEVELPILDVFANEEEEELSIQVSGLSETEDLVDSPKDHSLTLRAFFSKITAFKEQLNNLYPVLSEYTPLPDGQYLCVIKPIQSLEVIVNESKKYVFFTVYDHER
jgi:hypothetical protein